MTAEAAPAERLPVLARLRPHVSRAGNSFLAGALPDGRVLLVLARKRPDADGCTHA
jgi:hypothetical protein